MKKIFPGAIFVGLALGVYFVFKNRNKKEVYLNSQADNSKYNASAEKSSNLEEIKEMYEEKERSAQAIHKRHADVVGTLSDAYKNIMEDIDSIENDEVEVDDDIEIKNIETVQELDSLSDELDELLK